MGNLLRIVIGLTGLIAAAWSASRTLRRRRHGQPADAVATGAAPDRTGGQEERDGSEEVGPEGKASFRETFLILGATAGGIVLTLLI